MNRKQLLKLIEEGETLTTEFKQRFSSYEKIAKEMIALANTKGGSIIFGIDDDGSIHGVESEKSEAELVRETAENYCEPKINYLIIFIELEGKEIVIIEIPESDSKPHRIQDYRKKIDLNTAQVYIRVNDKSILVGKEMIKLLQAQNSQQKLKNYTIGNNEKTVFKFLEENDYITVKQLSHLANLSMRRASRTLINLVRADILAIHTKDNGENIFSSKQ